jgi:hypothetical protein
MRQLGLATYDSLYPHPGIAHQHFGTWELINDTTGTLVVIAGLMLPFYSYSALRGSPDCADARSRLRGLTSLAVIMLLAAFLGSA